MGLDVITLSEHYGVSEGELVADVDWLADVGGRGWAVLKADAQIRKRPAERRALIEAKVKAFLVSGQLRADQTVKRVAANLDAMHEVCADEGPWIFRLHETRLEKLRLEGG